MTDIPQATNNTPTDIPTPAPDSAVASDVWYSKIEDPDLKSYTEKKNWKDPIEAVKSYREAEKRLGTSISLPKENATPEELNAFYAKIGRPETPEAYQLPVPEGQDTAFAQSMAKIMFDTGVPAKSAQALAMAWNEYQAQQAQLYEAEQAKAEQEQMATLKNEWGAKYETNEVIAKNAVKAFGISPEQIDQLQQAMGFDGTMKFFQNLGSKIGEDKFIGNDTGVGSKATMVMSKEQANAEYSRLMTDTDFAEKWRKDDPEAVAIINNIWKYR